MTQREFCQRGNSEQFKCFWHGAMGVLAFGAFAYNTTAWMMRREKHLALNAGIYGALTLLEAKKVRHHLGAP